jgi:DNA-binding transcriptional LysR family regulator
VEPKGLEGGHLRIASFRSAATHLLPDVLAEFCRRYPAIAVHITEHDDRPDVEHDLRKGRAEIGITYAPVGPEFKAWEICGMNLSCYFHPNFNEQNPVRLAGVDASSADYGSRRRWL